MRWHYILSPRLLLFALAVPALAAGCGSGAPKTYPVEGKIVFKDNQGNVRLLRGGMVRFQSVDDPEITGVGEIEDDGSFSIGMIYKEKALSGIPEGKYKVRIEPPVDDDEGKPLEGLIDPKFGDFNQSNLTFTVPVSGEILITVEPPS